MGGARRGPQGRCKNRDENRLCFCIMASGARHARARWGSQCDESDDACRKQANVTEQDTYLQSVTFHGEPKFILVDPAYLVCDPRNAVKFIRPRDLRLLDATSVQISIYNLLTHSLVIPRYFGQRFKFFVFFGIKKGRGFASYSQVLGIPSKRRSPRPNLRRYAKPGTQIVPLLNGLSSEVGTKFVFQIIIEAKIQKILLSSSSPRRGTVMRTMEV